MIVNGIWFPGENLLTVQDLIEQLQDIAEKYGHQNVVVDVQIETNGELLRADGLIRRVDYNAKEKIAVIKLMNYFEV